MDRKSECPPDSDLTPSDVSVDPGESVKEQLRRLGPVGPLAIISLTLPAIGGFTLLGTLQYVGPWLKSHGELGIMLYVVCFMSLAGLALLPTYAQAILGGWAFGFIAGFPAALTGLCGGASLGYLIGRVASKERAVRLIDEHAKWRVVRDALVGSGFWRTLTIVTLLRLPPNVPFSLSNLVMAATKVNFVAYFLGTLIGMAPRTALVVYLSSKAKGVDITSVLDSANGKDARTLMFALITTVIVLAIIGYLAKRALDRVAPGTFQPAPAAMVPEK